MRMSNRCRVIIHSILPVYLLGLRRPTRAHAADLSYQLTIRPTRISSVKRKELLNVATNWIQYMTLCSVKCTKDVPYHNQDSLYLDVGCMKLECDYFWCKICQNYSYWLFINIPFLMKVMQVEWRNFKNNQNNMQYRSFYTTLRIDNWLLP